MRLYFFVCCSRSLHSCACSRTCFQSLFFQPATYHFVVEYRNSSRSIPSGTGTVEALVEASSEVHSPLILSFFPLDVCSSVSSFRRKWERNIVNFG